MSTKYSNNSDQVRIKIVIKFNNILNNLKLSKIIEKSIYNYVIDVAKNKNILRQKKLEYLFVETRTIDDELYGIGEKIGNNEFFSDHYRRFIVPNEFKKNFKKNFKIIYFKTSKPELLLNLCRVEFPVLLSGFIIISSSQNIKIFHP